MEAIPEHPRKNSKSCDVIVVTPPSPRIEDSRVLRDLTGVNGRYTPREDLSEEEGEVEAEKDPGIYLGFPSPNSYASCSSSTSSFDSRPSIKRERGGSSHFDTRNGPGREGGWWSRLLSPGGTRHFYRRSSTTTHQEFHLRQHPSWRERSPMRPLPRRLQAEALKKQQEFGSPAFLETSNSVLESRLHQDSGFQSANSSLASSSLSSGPCSPPSVALDTRWVSSSMRVGSTYKTSASSGDQGPGFDRASPRSCTLPRNMQIGTPNSWSPSWYKGWWHRVLSPRRSSSSPRERSPRPFRALATLKGLFSPRGSSLPRGFFWPKSPLFSKAQSSSSGRSGRRFSVENLPPSPRILDDMRPFRTRKFGTLGGYTPTRSYSVDAAFASAGTLGCTSACRILPDGTMYRFGPSPCRLYETKATQTRRVSDVSITGGTVPETHAKCDTECQMCVRLKATPQMHPRSALNSRPNSGGIAPMAEAEEETSSMEESSEGHSSPDESVEGGDGNDEVKWDRSNSLRKPFHRTRTSSSNHDPTAAAALSDTELSKISVSLLDVEGGGSETSERAIDVGPVGAWATSFEKLLEDPAGLHTFAEFLKKEFSHENIYFWTACERYKRLSDQEERRSMAKTIFERHLCIGASEPVNVDSHARQVAQEGLHSPDEFLFEQAEKQIFNLMKFDSYSRFLKSNLYKDCMACDLRGQPLPYPGDDTLDPDLRISQDDSHIKLKKSKSDADERRRKSLLPWHRKDRSKSKDRGEAEYRRRKNLLSRGTNNSDSSSIRSDVTGSRTSLNSSDLALVTRHAVSRESLTSGEIGSLSGSEGYNLCRVMLPDLSNSVVAVRPGEAVRTLLTRLLDRRGLNYSTYDVFYHKGDKPVDQTEDSSVLGGQEVRVEQRVLFRLDLPSRKTVCVKAKPHKISQDVLKPILHKYGYKLDLMAIHKAGEEKNINLKGPVTELDNEKFVVQTKEGIKEWGVECGRTYKKRTNTLDEITNRVFEDLLKGKLEQNFDELGVLDFDTRSNKTDRSSDRSSSILGSFSRRNSLAPEKETKPRKPGNRSSVHEGGGVGRGMVGVAGADGKVVNVQAKRRGTTQTNSKQENDELYEGLKRAQRSRLDDQRGTEINFELPDFLKCDQQQDKENQHTHITDQLFAHFDCSFGENGVIPSHHEAEEYFSMAHPEVWGGVPVSALNSRGSSTGVNGRRSANATLIAAELEFDDLDVTLRDDPLCQVLPEPTSSHVEQLDFVPPPLLSDENLPSSSTAALLPPPPSSLLLSPPPLPPKPKLAALRGPPPRPPSRQLHLIHPPTFSSTSDDEPNPHIPTKHIVQQPQDKFNISFV